LLLYCSSAAQAFFKEAYKARVRKQQSETGDDGRGRGGRNMARSEAWLENLCQAILDSEAGIGSGHHLGHHDGGMGLGDGDDMGGEDLGPSTAEELAVAAAMHAHAAAQHTGGVGDHAGGLDPSALAASMAAAAQLAQLPVNHEVLAQGLDNETLMAAAAAAAAAAQAQHPHQHQHQHQQVGIDQMAALEAAAAAAVAAAQQQR
jgi:hypothetical protein